MPADVYTVTINGHEFKFLATDPDAPKGFNRLIDMLRSLAESDKKDIQQFAADTWAPVIAISDLVGGTTFPSPEIYDKVVAELDNAKSALNSGLMYDAVDYIKMAVQDSNENARTWHDYLSHASAGAASTVKGLQIVVDLSIAVDAGLATGGVADWAGGGMAAEALAGGLTGEVSSAGANAFDQHVEVLIGERAEIDWSEVGKAGLTGLATGIVGGLAGGPIKSWMGENLPRIVGTDYALFTRLAESLSQVTGESLEPELLMTTAQQIWGDVMTKLPEAVLTNTLEATIKGLSGEHASTDKLLDEWVKGVFAKDEVVTALVDVLRSLVTH